MLGKRRRFRCWRTTLQRKFVTAGTGSRDSEEGG
jgi:hypothetical protein